ILVQVTVPVYYERGGSRVPGTVCREVILGEALEASLARAQRHKWVVSSSLVVVAQEQGTCISLVAFVVPLNSIVVDDYTISDVSMLRTAADSETHNLCYVDNQQVPNHDDIFDTNLLDKPAYS
ncbi:hypothetical protein Tco_0480127, partial [Tanacetum coccineum]